MRTRLTSISIVLCSAFGITLLCAKYFWSLYAFPGVPFGYDAGIYRYLFITHALGLPPFILAPMDVWAQSHPLGLFFFSSIAIKLGLPVDWLLGWIWNLFPILLSLVFAYTTSRRSGSAMGVILLYASVLSVVQEQGFLMMYWKVFLSLLFIVVAFHCLEKKSWWSVPFGMLTIAVHQQIGLIFVLASLSHLLLRSYRQGWASLQMESMAIFLSMFLGGLWYVPNYQRALLDVLPSLLRAQVIVGVGIVCAIIVSVLFLLRITRSRTHRIAHIVFSIVVGLFILCLPFIGTAPSLFDAFVRFVGQQTPGAFFSVHEYLALSSPLIFLGVIGLLFSLRREQGTLLQFSALYSGVAVLGLFFFYRRFILPLDFFLLPFVALACRDAWNSRRVFVRFILVSLLIIQAVLTFQFLSRINPHVTRGELDSFRALSAGVSDGSTVIVLDNMAPWVVGFLPKAHVSGPGIFDSRPYVEWERFLLGSNDDRQRFFDAYPHGTFFYASDVFFRIYPPEVQSVLMHPCLEKTVQSGLYRSVCGQ